MTISEYLASQRELNIPIVTAFMDSIADRYQSLTPDFAQLLTELKAYLIRGGKWHRPALTMLAYQIAGGEEIEKAQKGSIITELMHRFLLIHDDIIDQDYVRHNGPTIEKIYRDYFCKTYPKKNDVIYSKGQAIVAGDVLYSLVSELLTETQFKPEIILAAIKGMNQLMMETAAGWQLQNEQNYMQISDVTEADYFKGMQLVSAQYSVVWPLRIGQILAGRLTQESWDKAIEGYGWHTGAAFQITDDVLGMFGAPETTGKPVGHDYREGKKTLLILTAYSRASHTEKEFLDNTIGTAISPQELDRVQSIIRDTGSLALVQQRAQEHAEKATAELATISSTNTAAITLLGELVEMLSHRDF